MNLDRKTIVLCYIYVIVVSGLIWLLFRNYPYGNLLLVEYAFSFYIIGFFVIYFMKAGNILSIEVLFNGFGLLYSNFYIGELIIKGEQIPEVIYYAMMLSHFSIIVFDIFFCCSHKSNKIFFLREKKEYTYDIHRLRKLLIIFLAICIITELYVIVYKIGLQDYFLADRATKTLLLEGYSLLSFYKTTIPVISVVFFYNYFKYGYKRDVFLFAVSFVISIFNAVLSASRAELLSIFLPCLFVLYYWGKIKDGHVIFFGIVGILFFGMWKSLYGGHHTISFDSEFNTWYKICKNILSDPNSTFLYGKSYLNTLINMIVPVTHTGNLSEWYLQVYEPEVLARGGGRGFSGVLEAYINFGIFGNVLVFGFYGWLMKQFDKKNDFQIVVYIAIMVSMYMFFRAEAYSIWKNMVWFKIYPFAIIYYFSRKNIEKENV